MRTRKSTKSSGRSARQDTQATRPTSPTPSPSSQRAKRPRQTKRARQRQRAAERSRTKARCQRQAARGGRARQAAKLRQQRAERRHELHGQGVQAHAVDVLRKNLKLRDHSPGCSATLVFTVLLAAAGQCTSIAAACYRLEKAPSEQTIYNALEATLPDYTELERRVNRALRAHLPARLRRRRQRLAIDLSLIPYHGQPQDDPKEIYRSQAKHGTSHFHAYASLYLVCQGQRFTVALTRVELGESMKVVVQRLLLWGRRAGVRPQLLLLDRGFFSVAVIGYLKRARVPFLMPAVARGRKPADGNPATGIRAFKLRKRGGWGEHTLCSGKQRANISIAVCCGNYRGQWKRHGRYAWVYAYGGFKPGSLRWVADTYRTRFGIETSYRQLNQGRIKTSTRSPLRRYLYVAIALILRNVWVWLHWEVVSTPRRGRRRLNLQRLTLEGMLVFLVHVAEALLGFCDRFTTERPPPATLTAGTG
jgi:hypothetical protein